MLAAPCPSLFSDSGNPAQDLVDAFLNVRNETERRAAPLTPEDQLIQSMPDASPAKWHRAHTTWFFEQFLLGEHREGYTPFHPDYAYLFNSYYVSAGPRHARHQRGHLTRPGADEITAYRRHVDAAVVKFFHEAKADTLAAIAPLVEVGLNHTVGHTDDTFHFDNEKPAHRALVGPVRLARNLVTNAEWLAFIKDGGYSTPTLWLMDGFAAVSNEQWQAPGHWREVDGEWRVMTLAGLKPVDAAAPVCHVSYYEADAFARWSGKHLPTEMEWEVAARAGHLNDAFGIVWQWTRSAYAPYPGYRAIEGALGEYNGKFMVNQLVLRGSSLATPSGHSRITYRNFFYPHHRWQFTGLRLADYAT
jgi:formylglycine-generating enzyme required for sulfatase activity